MKTLLMTTALALAANAGLADEIRVLNWQGYGTDIDWAVAAFTEKTGHTVVHEYFTSEQEMLTKLRTNPGAYDVVLVNSAFTGQAVGEGLLAPIDTAKIANFADLDPSLTSIAVSNADFPTAPTSLSVLWDPALKGRVSIRDDGLEAVQLAAMASGQNINDIKDMDAVKEKLTALLPQITTFWGSENDWNQFMAAGDFAVATYWSGSASRSIGKGLPISFVVPDEGAIGWLDGLSVPASSTKADAAHAFIDWMADPAFYAKWDAEGAPATSNAKAAAALPETSFNRKVLGDPAVVAKVQFMRPVSDENREAYLKLWQDLKAAQ
jgi:spermidine/putrescine transport system substrate-binding protein